ncbi:MAG: transposase domain-containing protein [Dermatophilaceae bacterium]
MGMALHSEGSYEDVLALICDGLAWAHRQDGSGTLADKAAISHARGRLGPEPMALLFERVAKPLGVKDTPGCWLAGRRLVAIDGTCLDLPDTPANDAFFGRPRVLG